MRRGPWQAVLAAMLCLGVLFWAPSLATQAAASAAAASGGGPGLSSLFLILACAAVSMARPPLLIEALALLIGVHAAAFILMTTPTTFSGAMLLAFLVVLAAAWLMAWRLVGVVCELPVETATGRRMLRLAAPLLFGLWVLVLWETIVRGAGVSPIILPPPTAIGGKLAQSVAMLAADVVQTIFKSAFTGYVIGGLAGFIVAILADRFDFFRRGVMPIGNMMSALPIVGIAPVMVTWFGPDWPSKAAVVVAMTFFPMLVNTVAGLAAAGQMERDLMRSCAASYTQTLVKLRLPTAAPFIFNALKINSTLALIGAIVAEFFTTPVVGMGFRISTEIGLLRVDMAWAEIAVAALAGSVFYGVIVLIERAVTFWRPSIRADAGK